MSVRTTTVGDRVRRAAAMTVIVHAVRTGCALLLVLPLLSDLAPELAQDVHVAALGRAEVAALLEAAARSGPRLLFWMLGCIAGYALLSPLLALAWLRALAHEESKAASFARAASAYGAALALGACALAAWAAALAGAALALQPGPAGALPHSAQLERAWTIGCAAALALSGLLVSTAHDLARARLALGARLWPALRFAIAVLNARLLGVHALLAVATAAVIAAAELAGRAPFGVPAMLALCLQQGLLFGATLLRAAWLAIALTASQSTCAGVASTDRDLDAERVA